MIKFLNTRYFIVVLLFVMPLWVWVDVKAQTYELKIDRIINEKGSDPGATAGILKDSLGFIWFGTVDGLCRYDGFNYTFFRNVPGNSNSLSCNLIRSIALGSNNKMWIATQGGGLDCFDLSTETFTHYFHTDTSGVNSISGNEAWTVHLDRSGKVWVGAVGNQVDCFDPKSGLFKHYNVMPPDISVEGSITVRSIFEDSNGIIWIGMVQYGVSSLNPLTGEVKNYIYNPKENKGVYRSEVREITQDSKGNIIASAFGGGLFWYDKEKDTFSLNEALDLNTNLVSSVVEIRPNLYFVGTEHGLRVINTLNNNVISITSNFSGRGNISDNRVRKLYRDRTGILWLGLETGVDKIVEYQSFRVFTHQDGDENSFPSGTVRCVIKDKDQNIWAGIIDKGLVKYLVKEKRFILYQPDYKPESKKLSGPHITALLQDSRGDIWIGEWDTGLNRYNSKDNTFKHIAGTSPGLLQLSDNRIQFIREERPGVLWVGTENGLNKVYVDERRVVTYKSDPNNPNSLGGNSLQSNAFVKDKEGNLWLGAWSGGLTKMSFVDSLREKAVFTRWMNSPMATGVIGSNNVISLHLSNDTLLWIGTFGNGLNCFNIKNGSFKYYSTDDGLPNNVIFGILEDLNNTLWLSTDRGLANLNPRTEICKNYSKSDGLQDDHFYWGSTFKSGDGELFFGGLKGLNSFRPEEVKFNSNVPIPVITSIKVNEKDTVFQKPLWLIDEVILAFNQNYISFEFAALDYNDPNQNSYQIKLDGVDGGWRHVSRRVETYSNLLPDTYTFRLRVANNDGIVSASERIIKITILPPWHKTWWARTLFVVGIVLVIFLLYRIRVGMLESYAHRLEEEVSLRTQEILQQKSILEVISVPLKSGRIKN